MLQIYMQPQQCSNSEQQNRQVLQSCGHCCNQHACCCREYTTVEALADDYKSGALHPKDLKDALAAALNKILEPVRQHFEQDANAKALLKKVRSYATTR